MPKMNLILVMFVCVSGVLCQGDGSGTNGNLRLCVVESRGKYRRAPKHCPVLEKEGAGVECVVASDRMDCIRRMGKGTVDFGVFDPEDLVASQWANLDLLVTNELKTKSQTFSEEIACVVSRGFLEQSGSEGGGPDVILKNSTLCHPGHGAAGLSDTLTDYLESLVATRSCVPSLSLAENRLLTVANFFRAACKPGPWLQDEVRDAQLKRLYPSLCDACSTKTCRKEDSYWGRQGSLNCLTEGAGDVTWASVDDVRHRFGLNGEREALDDPKNFAYLCRDGSVQPLTANNTQPCVWLNVPWPVIVAKRKSAEAVTRLQESLTNDTAIVEKGWRSALLLLLESNSALAEPLRPQQAPGDYLDRARGFREAYSRSGCNPPRHVTVCTSSAAERSKCEWMSEAGAVYGAEPPVQCEHLASRRDCILAVASGAADAVLAQADWLVTAQRDHSLSAILYESNPIVREMHVVVAYVRADSTIKTLEDLRGRRAAFPAHDGVAWHSIAEFIKPSSGDCDLEEVVANHFGDMCVPVAVNSKLTEDTRRRLTKLCTKEDGVIAEGDEQALKLMIEGAVDVAFVSMDSLAKYTGLNGSHPWAAKVSANDTRLICPTSDKYCFFSWSSPGQVYVRSSLQPMRRQEIINVFQQLDQLFGKNSPFHTAAFTMYGPFGHESDVMFHDNMKALITANKLKKVPFAVWPRNYETTVVPEVLKKCSSSAVQVILSPVVFLVSLVLAFKSV